MNRFARWELAIGIPSRRRSERRPLPYEVPRGPSALDCRSEAPVSTRQASRGHRSWTVGRDKVLTKETLIDFGLHILNWCCYFAIFRDVLQEKAERRRKYEQGLNRGYESDPYDRDFGDYQYAYYREKRLQRGCDKRGASCNYHALDVDPVDLKRDV